MANNNSAQFLEDLQNGCFQSNPDLGSGQNGGGLLLDPGLSARAASFTPGSEPCQNLETFLEVNANDPNAVNVLAADITPDEMPALYTSLVQLSADQIRNVSHHLRNHRFQQNAQNADTASWPGLQHYYGGSAGDTVDTGRLSFFVDASKVDGSQDNTDFEVGYDLATDHFTLGMDYRISNELIAGAAFGNSDTTLEYNSARNQTDNKSDHFIVYGSWYRDNFAVDTMLGYASGEFDTRRSIQGETARGSTDNELMYFSLAGSYDFISGGLTYGTFASFDLMEGEIDAFEESDGGGWEVAFAQQDVKSQIFAVGAHTAYAASFGWGVLVPHARAEWRSELEDDRDLIAGRFVQDPASNFTITPDSPDNNWYQLSAGVSAQFAHGIAVFLNYEEVLEYADTDLSILTLGARWEM